MTSLGIRESPEFSEPLRPWLPADLLDNAARTIADNKTIMLGLPTIAGVALAAIQVGLVQLAVPGGLAGLFDPDPTSEDPFATGGGTLVLLYVVQAVLFTVVSSVLSGLIAVAAVRSQLGHRMSPRELMRAVRPSVPALVGVGVVQMLAFGLLVGGWAFTTIGFGLGAEVLGGAAAAGLIAFAMMIVGGLVAVLVGVRISMAGTVVLLEGRHAVDAGLPVAERFGVVGSLKRSWRLVKGRFWRVFGVLLFAGLVVYIVSNALQLGLSLLVMTVAAWAGLGNESAALALAIGVGIAAAVATVLTLIASLAFVAAVQALLYVDLRVRREGLDLWLRPALLPTAIRPVIR